LENDTLHLHSRAGFGLHPSEFSEWSRMSIAEQVEKMFRDAEAIRPLKIVVLKQRIEDMKQMDDDAKRIFRKQMKEQQQVLNLAWLNRLSTDASALREKMTLFWHHHFACRVDHPVYLETLNNIHREFALGNFKDLLLAVAKSPAMLLFLNNQQNKKAKPNENFARELLELFTIGRGNYTEADVKNAARAFTGWAFSRDTGEFQFRANQHDEETKLFFGASGNFGGEDIIQLILKDKRTATFLSRKLYRFFVNPESDAAHVEELATSLFDSNYNIGAWVKKLVTADWFYATKNRGNLIKSPVELIAGLQKLFRPKFADNQSLIFVQRVLGQVLFYPPNVAGWVGGKNWIDSSTILVRMHLGAAVVNDGEIDSEEKDDAPEDFMTTEKKGKRKLQATPDWNAFEKAIPRKWNAEMVQQFVLRTIPDTTVLQGLIPFSESNLKPNIVQYLSLPEYQLA
ncbi:MAG: DUF1800 domain-containing protein, partial [Bacteroidia bacterium]